MRTANVFTVKQLTIYPGQLLRKTILEGFQSSENSVLRKLSCGARCLKGEKAS